MYKLGKVLADPGILKIMHGSAWSITALQRDFGLYIVNLLDLREAAVELDYSSSSLSLLLSSCEDSLTQTADYDSIRYD